MTPEAWKAAFEFLNSPTVLGFLIVGVVFGGFKGWWYFGHEYQRVVDAAAADKAEFHVELGRKQAELERWQDVALDMVRLADATSRQALDAMELLPPRGDLGEPPRYVRGGRNARRS